jgi:hypothetical protein
VLEAREIIFELNLLLGPVLGGQTLRVQERQSILWHLKVGSWVDSIVWSMCLRHCLG